MTKKEVREYLTSGEPDFEFEYDGKQGVICLCQSPIVNLKFGSEESTTLIGNLFNFKFLDGYSLDEVAEKIRWYG